ncbi:MAG: hypothetical protein RI932_1168 [Pseudomonadota bacterium]|jgi:hypothetical protein
MLTRKMKLPAALSILQCIALSGCKQNKSASETQQSSSGTQNVQCDVIVVGGTTAAFSAAITAADNLQPGEVACLTEPTDWLGGQLTSSGVPAVDYAHHDIEVPGIGKVKTSDASRHMASQNKFFGEWMKQLGPVKNDKLDFPQPATCWVSVRCFPPTSILGTINALAATYEASGRLKVFRNTVVKSVRTENERITAVTVIQRSNIGTPPSRLSEQVEDWYSTKDSPNFKKKVITLAAPQKSAANGQKYFPVVIDATEWGEVLVLSGSSYLQGMERNENAPVGQGAQETCGQAIVYPMTLRMNETPVPDSALARGRWSKDFQPKIEAYKQSLVKRGLLDAGKSLYSIATHNRAFTFDEVWSYRRLVVGPVERTSEKVYGFFPSAQIGDITNQNWELGNDYPYRYLFLPISEARSQARSGDWTGGIDVKALDEAELQAWGWVDHLRKNATVNWNGQKRDIGQHIVLSEALGTPYGLSKVPYIRDTRRSIGYGSDGSPFVYKYGEMFTGVEFPDSVGIGAYVADRHPSRNPNFNGERCFSSNYPAGFTAYPRPFTLPMRAHTNSTIPNLLVAGKTMAQTFHVNSATRLHPIEFVSGTGAGALASFMAQSQVTSHFVMKSEKHVALVQERIKKYQPLVWSKEVLASSVAKPPLIPGQNNKSDKAENEGKAKE